MDRTPLAAILGKRAPELAQRYEYIKSMAASGFQKYATMIGYLTDHGVEHYENVEANLGALLPEANKYEYPAEEIFLLLCAVHFHDVGLLVEKREKEPWTQIRKEHVDRGYDYLHDHHEELGFNRFEGHALKSICLGHGGDTLYALPETTLIHHDQIRIRFLSALLRVADELDLDYTRVSKYILEMRQIPEDSLRHWRKHAIIKGVNINPIAWAIEVYAMPQNDTDRELIEDMVARKVQKELDYVQPIFEQNGLYYRSVTVHYEEFGHRRTLDV